MFSLSHEGGHLTPGQRGAIAEKLANAGAHRHHTAIKRDPTVLWLLVRVPSVREVQKYATLAEHDGTNGTSFTRAASQRAVFMCVTEHTRNINGTALSQDRRRLVLF